MAQPSPTSGPTADQKDIPAETARPASPGVSSTRAPTPPAPPSEDLYDDQKCTIMVVMQLRPQSQDGGPRSVLLSVQNGTGNKEDLPLYRLLSSEEELGGPLPPALAALLEALRQDLPARKQRNAERAAKKTVTGATATRTTQKPGQTPAKDAAKQKKPGTGTTTASVPPLVPTTTTPVPKEGLVLGGLFDDL